MDELGMKCRPWVFKSVPRRKQHEVAAPADDNLKIRDVGPWSKDKHYFLSRYIDAFTTAMRNNPRWSGLHYIDLFAGAGIERVEASGLEWGSPLIAALSRYPFTRLHVCELDAENFTALEERLRRVPQPTSPRLYRGDANLVVNQLVAQVPMDSLNLAFVDPCNLAQLKFPTLRALAGRRTDIILFFPDYTDAVRNMLTTYKGNPNSPLSEYLGTTEWEADVEKVSWESCPATLVEVLKRQMRSLGYRAFEEERIYREDYRRLYKLVFCSMHDLGGEIWARVAKSKPDKQGRLF
jgi:three-Cys-motif partner protein